MRAAIIAALLLLSGVARAQDLKDRFNIRLYLTGMYMVEQESNTANKAAQQASPFELAYGDLRAVIDARRLGSGFELHLDGRVRLTGEFSTATATTGGDQQTARGYLGGKEYQVTQAWLLRRGQQWDFGLGRMIVTEADALRLDGARLWYRPNLHWAASLYAGGYPDPYSRSVLTDYQGSYAVAGGGSGAYTYDKIWGSFSINGSYLAGNNAGGPLIGDPATTAAYASRVAIETPLVWGTWTNYVRLASWLDFFHDLALDLSGQAGVQLRRLDILATARAGKHITIRLGYDHLSAFAIEMWLTRLLQDRGQHLANTIENNLLVDRTARDEARGQIDVTFGNFSVFGEGRFRRRALVSLTDDPQFVQTGTQVAPGLAYDATLGLRDRGSIWRLRPTLWVSYIADYRSRSAIAALELARSFLDERLGFNLAFLYANTKDALAGQAAGTCTAGATAPTIPLLGICAGTRDGAEYELGFTMTTQPASHWFGFFDYRLVADTTNGALGNGAQPTILTHVLLLRIEARY